MNGLGRRFWLLATARTVSVAGNGFGRVALAFGVLALPHSGPAELSLVLACQAVPQVILVLFGGVLADRISRGRLMVVAESTAALAWAGLAVAVATRTDALWLVCGLAVIAGAASILFAPALTGVVPELVTPGSLQRANGVIRIGQNIALLAGLGISGVVVAFVGAPWALAVDAASYIVGAVLIALIRVPNPVPRATTFVRDLREGAKEFFSRQWLWVVVAQFAIVVAALNATVGVLGPLLARESLGGASSWGFIVAAQALGTIVGAGIAIRVRVRRPIRTAVFATFVFAAPILLLALGAPVIWCAAAMLVSGVANDIFGVLWQTTLQTQVPRDALSRVSAYDIFGSICFAPIGLIVAGPVSLAVGVHAALFGCAALVVVASAAALLSPSVRRLTARPVSPNVGEIVDTP
jgi:predicted MFS family arabinose efflux permease